MCSYKMVKVFFEVWGFQGRVETGVHKVSIYPTVMISVVCPDVLNLSPES